MTKRNVLVHNCDLPDSKIVKEKGVTIEHYYKSGDHKPGHMHVSGEGPKTKIGEMGIPIKGQPGLSSAQKEVVKNNKGVVRKAGKKIVKYLKKQDND